MAVRVKKVSKSIKKTRIKEGPFLQTPRAKATPGKTVAPGGTKVIRAKGKKPLAFKKGRLHESLNVPQGQPIPASKRAAALRGEYGKKAKKQAVFAFKGALAKGRKTAGR